MNKKEQKSGDSSTNIQADNINITQGVSYKEVKEMVLDIFKTNYYDLSGKAIEIAKNRAEEITEKFLEKLSKENPKGLAQAEDPDFQHSVFTIQKEFARCGDEELGDLLVDLLVDRTKQNQRSILQIVLNESMVVAPKLTDVQLSALSIIFVFRYSKSLSIIDDNTLGLFLDKQTLPFVSNLSKNMACYQHLEYTGCASIGISEVKLEKVFNQTYAGLFFKGFEQNEISNFKITIGNDSRIFMQCLNDKTKLQIRALNKDDLEKLLETNNISAEDKQIISSLFKNHKMSESEVKAKCISLRGFMSDIFDVWDNSWMKNTTLTSVGIAIGHGNLKRLIGEFADLSIWIN